MNTLATMPAYPPTGRTGRTGRPRTFATLDPVGREAVIRKIMALASATDHWYRHRDIGCCYTQMCVRHHEAYIQALDRLVTYATRGCER